MADSAVRLPDEAVQQRLSRIDELVELVEQAPGPTSEAALDVVQALVEVYGEALARMLDAAAPPAVEQMLDDELLRHLLVLHSLHPDTVEQRVRRVLDELRPEIESRGGQVELVQIDDGVARIQLSGGGCGSCGSSTDPLEEAVADSVLALAPELGSVTSVPDEGGTGVQALIPVDALFRRPATTGRTA
jgi:Fe-S cluster biogenesis protein NfuA